MDYTHEVDGFEKGTPSRSTVRCMVLLPSPQYTSSWCTKCPMQLWIFHRTPSSVFLWLLQENASLEEGLTILPASFLKETTAIIGMCAISLAL